MEKENFFLSYNTDLKERSRELRKNMTYSEKKIWQYLKQFNIKNTNKKFTILRQKPIDNFIVDFYISKLKLVIEIDGESHFDEQGIAYDSQRTAILEGYGLKILRFTNSEINTNFDLVCEKLKNILN